MLLTFADKKFILTNFDSESAPTSRAWILNHANKTYQTKDIEAAHAYKRYASQTVKNIFKNLMLRPVPFPSVAPLVPSDLKLKKFQAEKGVPFLLSRNKSYLAHEPGLGKSAELIAAINTNPGPALVSPPSFLKLNWAREITKWSIQDYPNISIIEDSTKENKVDWSADYVIAPHSMLSKPWVMDGILKTNFKYKAVDEVQAFQTIDAARSVALWGGQLPGKIKSPGLMHDCDHEVYLSGTPIPSRPISLYPLLYGVAPHLIDFKSYQDFGFRYGGAWQDARGSWHFTGSQREEELHQILTKDFMQVIKKRDVLKELPKKLRSVVVMDNDPRDTETIKLDRELLKRFDPANVNKPTSIAMYAKLHHINGLAKVNWAADFVHYYLNSDAREQIILYGFHRDVCEKLFMRLKHFKPHLVLGGLKNSERQTIVDKFQSGYCRLVVGNEAMNLGLTMTKGYRTIHAEYSTSPAANIQGEDRVNRIGSDVEYTYHQYIVLPGSLDETRLRSFIKREDAINKIIY